MKISHLFLILAVALMSATATETQPTKEKHPYHPTKEKHPYHPYHPKLQTKANTSQVLRRSNSTVVSSPTASPTESPAPSPSPSSIPTMAPTGTQPPTKNPTSAPTESPAPSPSPSSIPTQRPSSLPSEVPTYSPTKTKMPSESPTLSQAPSASPSSEPSVQPSLAPTRAPSGAPSSAPSRAPSVAPSAQPSIMPTQTPSSEPTGSPTEEAFKTKFSNIDFVLMDIEREMNDTQLATFEITTLEFIRDTVPKTEGYEIEILAVTLLSQKVVYPDGDSQNAGNQGKRRMEAKSGLEVKFKAVGVVTEGVAPVDFNFKKDLVSPGFEDYMDEYLYYLSKSDAFFEPLIEQTTFEEKEPESKGKFVAAIVFSVIAFLVAVFAAIYAVRRHLDAKRRRRRAQSQLYDGNKSQTYSEDSAESTDESDEENRRKSPLRLKIFSPGKTDLENVPITPRSIASPFKQDYRDSETSPLSPGTAKNSQPTSMLEETGAAIRKWLSSPRGNANDNKKNQPPRPSKSPDPIALKASTTEKPKAMNKGNVAKFNRSQVTIPVSFFGRETDTESEASGTPMGSLADSAASSFFNRVGRSVFTGRPSSDSFLRARSQFSPRNSIENDEMKKRNDEAFAPKATTEPTLQSSLLEDNKNRSQPYQASEVSDVSLNENKEDRNTAAVAPSSVPSARNSTFYNTSSTLGARALDAAIDESSLGALRSKSESYDVFAPPGPIGIVVDTSKNGPAVHSLKNTSPMLGLINPGDLIIALDDEDTRKMTAASLTRLMAKKSRQKERKITLLSIDGF
eukprot:scaffold1087_cov136-Cylindrotheca_fusiformis.AAC.19